MEHHLLRIRSVTTDDHAIVIGEARHPFQAHHLLATHAAKVIQDVHREVVAVFRFRGVFGHAHDGIPALLPGTLPPVEPDRWKCLSVAHEAVRGHLGRCHPSYGLHLQFSNAEIGCDGTHETDAWESDYRYRSFKVHIRVLQSPQVHHRVIVYKVN